MLVSEFAFAGWVFFLLVSVSFLIFWPVWALILVAGMSLVPQDAFTGVLMACVASGVLSTCMISGRAGDFCWGCGLGNGDQEKGIS